MTAPSPFIKGQIDAIVRMRREASHLKPGLLRNTVEATAQRIAQELLIADDVDAEFRARHERQAVDVAR